MSYFSQVAKMFGIKLYERFSINNIRGKFYFTPYGLYNEDFEGYCDEILMRLLVGTVKIDEIERTS